MGATSDDLMDIARAGAERIDMPDRQIRYPSFGDIEDQQALGGEVTGLVPPIVEERLRDKAKGRRQKAK